MDRNNDPRYLRPDLLLSQTETSAPRDIPFEQIESPAEILDLRYLEDNLKYLADLQARAGVNILFAQKAYSLFATYPLMSKYLSGTTSSGLYEAKLAQDFYPGGILQVFSPAFKREELEELLTFADYIIFNSPSEWQRWKDLARTAAAERKDQINQGQASKPIYFGLRVNPEFSEIEEAIYNPAAPGSRLGTTIEELHKALDQNPDFLSGISGFHFHSLCEEGAEELAGVVDAFLEKFVDFLPDLTWLNLGGGHHFTRRDYNVDLFLQTIEFVKSKAKADVKIFVEPGEAIPLDCGWLLARVLDTPYNTMNLAILDTSAACHMPDVLEMPYRPRLFRLLAQGNHELAGNPGEKAHTYRLGGPTCLAGDIIGDYSFDSELKRGDMLVFGDMSIYSHVKRNSFNGMPLVDIYSWSGPGSGKEEGLKTIRKFTYEDFRDKLGTV